MQRKLAINITIDPTHLTKDDATLLQRFLLADERQGKELKQKVFQPKTEYHFVDGTQEYRIKFTHKLIRKTKIIKAKKDNPAIGKIGLPVKDAFDNKTYRYTVYKETDAYSRGKGHFGSTYSAVGKLKHAKNQMHYHAISTIKPDKKRVIKKQKITPNNTVEMIKKESLLGQKIARTRTEKAVFEKATPEERFTVVLTTINDLPTPAALREALIQTTENISKKHPNKAILIRYKDNIGVYGYNEETKEWKQANLDATHLKTLPFPKKTGIVGVCSHELITDEMRQEISKGHGRPITCGYLKMREYEKIPALGNLKASRPTLDDFIKKNKYTLTISQRLDLSIKLLNALNEIHKNGVISNDIKPENIFVYLSENGELDVAIGDFGLGREITEPLKADDICGSPAWISPEMIKSPMSTNEKSDLYSMGRVLRYLWCDDVIINEEKEDIYTLAARRASEYKQHENMKAPSINQIEKEWKKKHSGVEITALKNVLNNVTLTNQKQRCSTDDALSTFTQLKAKLPKAIYKKPESNVFNDISTSFFSLFAKQPNKDNAVIKNETDVSPLKDNSESRVSNFFSNLSTRFLSFMSSTSNESRHIKNETKIIPPAMSKMYFSLYK